MSRFSCFERILAATTMGAACLFLFTTTVAQSPAAPGVVVGVGNFSHIVASLERSVQFYRDVIGLHADGEPRVFAGDLAMKIGNTPGAQSFFTRLEVPGSPLGVEIIEYKNIERRPAHPRLQDPGAANLILTVRDIDAIVARARSAGVRMNTPGGSPATIQGGGRVVFLQDPDGFFVQLFQPAARPETTAPAGSNVIGSSFEIVVSDTDRTMRGYKEALGFDVQVGASFDGAATLMNAAGTPGARVKRSVARIPGTSVTMAFLEFKDIDRRPLQARFQDPGTPVLQLRVRDVYAATAAWKKSGGEVITAGGEPVNLGNLTLVVLRDANNLMLELIPAQ